MGELRLGLSNDQGFPDDSVRSGTGVASSRRYRIDDLRRLATELLAHAGLKRERASSYARWLLWYDEAELVQFGLSGLSDWLDQLRKQQFDPDQEGKIGLEQASTAVIDSANGLPLLVAARAAEVAGQKARDTGTGIVRVQGISPLVGSLSVVASELAVGPYIAAIFGPGHQATVALPSPEGLPIVFDSSVAASPTNQGETQEAIGPLLASIAPWTIFQEPTDLLVAAIRVTGFGSLESFHSQVSKNLGTRLREQGWLVPSRLNQHREKLRVQGIELPESVELRLRNEAEAAQRPFPALIT